MRKILLMMLLVLTFILFSSLANAWENQNSYETMEKDHARAQNDYNQRQLMQRQQQTINLLMRQEQREIERQSLSRREQFEQKLHDNFYGSRKNYHSLNDY